MAGRLIGRGLNALSQAVLARQIGPSAFGLFSIAWALLRVVSLLGPLGMDSAMVRFGPARLREDPRRFRGLFYFTAAVALAAGAVYGALCYLGAGWIAREVFRKQGLEPVLRMLALALPLVVLLRQLAAATLASRRVKYTIATEEVGQPGMQLALFLALGMLAGWTIHAALLSLTASFGIACLLALVYVARLYPQLLRRGPTEPVAAAEVLSFSIPMAFAGFFGSFSLWADRLVAGYFLSESDTGVYATVSVVTSVFAMILSGVKLTLSPTVSDLHARNEPRQIEALYRLGTRWALYVTLPLLIAVCLAPGRLLSAVFGGSYAGGATPLVVLSLAQLANVATGPYDTLLVMTGRQKSWLILSGVMLLGNVALVAALAPTRGLLGASLGMAGSVVLVSLIGVIVVRRSLGMTPHDRRSWKGVVAAVITVIGMAALNYAHQPSGLIEVGLFIVSAYVCFAACLLALGLEVEDREVLQAAKHRFLKK